MVEDGLAQAPQSGGKGSKKIDVGTAVPVRRYLGMYVWQLPLATSSGFCCGPLVIFRKRGTALFFAACLPPPLAHSLMHASTSEADTALEGLAAAHDMHIVHKILMKAASAIHEQAWRHFSAPETSK